MLIWAFPKPNSRLSHVFPKASHAKVVLVFTRLLHHYVWISQVSALDVSGTFVGIDAVFEIDYPVVSCSVFIPRSIEKCAEPVVQGVVPLA
jgi:hypothetical protein